MASVSTVTIQVTVWPASARTGRNTAKLNALVESVNKGLSEGTTPYTAETYLKTTSRQSIETKVLYDKIVGEAIASATFTEAK